LIFGPSLHHMFLVDMRIRFASPPWSIADCYVVARGSTNPIRLRRIETIGELAGEVGDVPRQVPAARQSRSDLAGSAQPSDNACAYSYLAIDLSARPIVNANACRYGEGLLPRGRSFLAASPCPFSSKLGAFFKLTERG
jgi:hypothetical protein